MRTYPVQDSSSRRDVRRGFLRIALVANEDSEQAEDLAQDLVKQGHQLQLIRRRRHRWEQPRAQETLQEVLVPSLPAPSCLTQLWRSHPVDTVHVIGGGPLASLATWAAHQMQLPVSLDAPDHPRRGWSDRLADAWRQRLRRKANTVLVTDLHEAARLRDQGVQRLRLAPRGLDLQVFHPSQRSFSLRHQWGLRADTPVLAHVGPVEDAAVIAALRGAMGALLDADPDARLLLLDAGRVPPQLQALCPLRQDDWQDRVLTRPGGERQPSLATQLASADVLLVPAPSRRPQLLAQGLACGLAVVARRDDHSQTCIEDGHTGYLVDDAQQDGLAYGEAIRQLCAEPATVARLRLRAPASVSHLERSHAAARLAAVLHDLVRSHERCLRAATTLVVATDS